MGRPVVQCLPDGAAYAIGASVTVSYSCTDEMFGTGVASCSGDVSDGAALDTSTLGTFTFSVSGTDNAGNVTTVVNSYTVVPIPANDDFADAVLLVGDSGTWNGSNVGASVEPGEPDHVYLPTEASIWFQWTAQLDGYLTVDSFGSDFDTVLSVLDGERNDDELACNDDTESKRESEISSSRSMCWQKSGQ